jgi:ribosomal protein L28
MECKICGTEIRSGNLCEKCKKEIDTLSLEILKHKREINLNIIKHHYVKKKEA